LYSLRRHKSQPAGHADFDYFRFESGKVKP
jgi:hypothetical protein